MESQPHILRVPRTEAAQARGVVIVIDVIRAFTVAGYAFDGGARELWLVRTVEEAFALRSQQPNALLAGEVNGRLIPGFDLNNSPASVKHTDVHGRILIQRTGAGTQGAVGAVNASHILLSALTNARATVSYARTLLPLSNGVVTLLPTGDSSDFSFGNEDVVCADYLEALLQRRLDASEVLARGIAQLRASDRFRPWQQGDSDFPVEDISAVLRANCFSFAMVGERREWEGIEYVAVRNIAVDSST